MEPKLEKSDIKNLRIIRFGARLQLKIINKQLKLNSGVISDNKPDEEDTDRMMNIKYSYTNTIYQGDAILGEMKKIAEELIEKSEKVLNSNLVKRNSKESLSVESAEQLIKEIKELSKSNETIFNKGEETYKSAISDERLLKEQSMVKHTLDKLFQRKKSFTDEDFSKHIIPNLNMVKIPEEMIKGKIISHKFDTLKLEFLVVQMDSQQNHVDLVHLIDGKTQETATISYYKNISIIALPSELNRRITLLRNNTLKWLNDKKQEFSAMGAEKLRNMLTGYGVYTDKEIEQILKEIIGTAPINIKELIASLSESIESAKSNTIPDDYIKLFNSKILNLIEVTNTLPQENRASAFSSINNIIIQPIINDMKRFPLSLNAPPIVWITTLQRGVQQKSMNSQNQKTSPENKYKLAA